MTASVLAWSAHHSRRALPAVFARGIPIVMVATIVTILVFSNVPPNLIIAKGRWAEAFLAAYAIAMAGLIVQPRSFHLHRIALPLGVGAWMGRGGGFIDLVIDLGRYDLLGAVAERALILSLFLYFHATEVRRSAHAQVVASV